MKFFDKLLVLVSYGFPVIIDVALVTVAHLNTYI